MNVLHHVGDDYNQSVQDIDSAKDHILSSLNQIANCTKTLVFQLGFNWQGNIDLPLFSRGEKKEVIDFITIGTEEYWKLQAIGIAIPSDLGIVYVDLDPSNISRMDELGEFLNRPIFILESKTKDLSLPI
jgi:hypothetical protein